MCVRHELHWRAVAVHRSTPQFTFIFTEVLFAGLGPSRAHTHTHYQSMPSEGRDSVYRLRAAANDDCNSPRVFVRWHFGAGAPPALLLAARTYVRMFTCVCGAPCVRPPGGPHQSINARMECALDAIYIFGDAACAIARRGHRLAMPIFKFERRECACQFIYEVHLAA